MKKMTKILPLLAAMTLGSCGSVTTIPNLECTMNREYIFQYGETTNTIRISDQHATFAEQLQTSYVDASGFKNKTVSEFKRVSEKEATIKFTGDADASLVEGNIPIKIDLKAFNIPSGYRYDKCELTEGTAPVYVKNKATTNDESAGATTGFVATYTLVGATLNTKGLEFTSKAAATGAGFKFENVKDDISEFKLTNLNEKNQFSLTIGGKELGEESYDKIYDDPTKEISVTIPSSLFDYVSAKSLKITYKVDKEPITEEDAIFHKGTEFYFA